MTNNTPENPQAFEENLAQLEKILAALETNGATLADTLKQFETGITLIKTCHAQLNTMETTVEKLTASS